MGGTLLWYGPAVLAMGDVLTWASAVIIILRRNIIVTDLRLGLRHVR